MADTDLLIVGCGPAAWSCAITARKRGLACTVAAAPSASGWLRRAERVDNYPGLPGVSGKELLDRFETQAAELGAVIVRGLCRQLQPMGDETMALIGSDILTARAVVLALGAARPSLLPGEEELLGRGVSWCGTCDGMFYRGKRVAVLSSWEGGHEEALFLAGLAASVDYHMMQPHTPPEGEKIRLCEGRPLSLAREGDEILLTTDRGAAAYDGVFIFRPAVAPDRLLPGLALDGPFIRVDRAMRCGLPYVYACGDCTGRPLQVAKAVGEGNIAAISAAEDLMRKADA